MKTLSPVAVVALPLILFLAGCSDPFAGETLVALRVGGEPQAADWERAVPLDIEVWKGNVHVRPEIVALDGDTSHRSTPDCHHGPSSSDPVGMRLQALYNAEKIYLLLQWPDPTPDRDLGWWERQGDGWSARPMADDGVGLLWGPGARTEEGGGFRCQTACHMMEVDVYDGGTKMRMGMRGGPGQVLDLWRWRAGVTEPFQRADDMVVDGTGKRGDEGQELPSVNRSPSGPGPRQVGAESSPPYFLIEEPSGRQGDIASEALWKDGWWTLLLVRALDTMDPDDVVFTPGVRVPFSVSVFDNTFTEHHVLGGGAELLLWNGEARREDRRHRDEHLDF